MKIAASNLLSAIKSIYEHHEGWRDIELQANFVFNLLDSIQTFIEISDNHLDLKIDISHLIKEK